MRLLKSDVKKESILSRTSIELLKRFKFPSTQTLGELIVIPSALPVPSISVCIRLPLFTFTESVALIVIPANSVLFSVWETICTPLLRVRVSALIVTVPVLVALVAARRKFSGATTSGKVKLKSSLIVTLPATNIPASSIFPPLSCPPSKVTFPPTKERFCP